MKRRISNSIVVTGIIALTGWVLIHPAQFKKQQLENSANAKTEIGIVNRKPSHQLNTNLKLSAQSPSALKNKILPEDQVNIENVTQTLHHFKKIQSKTFKFPSEENEIQLLIKDEKKLTELANFLKSAEAINKTSNSEHAAAVDILLEALKNGNSKLAEELILNIIHDAQIENSNIESTTRLALAGTKAELMYHSTSIDQRRIENSLPGPISQKIWDNVQQAQAENLATSEKELHMDIAERSK